MSTHEHDEKRAIRREYINDVIHVSAALATKTNFRRIADNVRAREQDDEPETVDLIASGYEWICPKCDKLNHEIETKERVTCTDCGASWDVDDYTHAEG